MHSFYENIFSLRQRPTNLTWLLILLMDFLIHDCAQNKCFLFNDLLMVGMKKNNENRQFKTCMAILNCIGSCTCSREPKTGLSGLFLIQGVIWDKCEANFEPYLRTIFFCIAFATFRKTIYIYNLSHYHLLLINLKVRKK